MIYVLCSGGLGNQIFQYAYYLHLKQSVKDVSLDTSFFDHYHVHSGYSLKNAFGISGDNSVDHFHFLWRLRYALMSRYSLNRLGNVLMELENQHISDELIKDNDVLYGYWQSEKCFHDIKDQLVEKLHFHNLSNKSIELGERMRSEKSVAVHVRRTDYLKNPKYVDLSASQYYKNAIEFVNNTISNPSYYVFSDDIAWCKKSNLFGTDATYVDFNDSLHAYEDMFLMSCANTVITANSSFSWWAGYLGKHQYVIRPEKYLCSWSKEQDEKLYPKEWIVGLVGD